MLSPLKSFARGLFSPLAGFAYIFKRPALWRHVLIPVTINLVLTGLLVMALVHYAPDFANRIDQNFGEEWYNQVLKWLSYLLAILLGIVVVAATWLAAQAALCAWFYNNLARDVALDLGMKEEEIQDPPLVKEVFETLVAMAKVLAISLTCAALGLIPLVAPFALAAAAYFNSLTLATDYWSYPLSLRGQGPKERQAFTRQHRPLSLGLGGGVMLMTLVPLVNTLLFSTAVAGAMLLHKQTGEGGQDLLE